MWNAFEPVSTDIVALDLNFLLFPAVFITSQTVLRVHYYRWRNNEQLSVNWNTEIIIYMALVCCRTGTWTPKASGHTQGSPPAQGFSSRVRAAFKICLEIPAAHGTTYSHVQYALSPPSISTFHSYSLRLNSVKYITGTCHQKDRYFLKSVSMHYK
jgi:hypothetical protein